MASVVGVSNNAYLLSSRVMRLEEEAAEKKRVEVEKAAAEE